MKPEELSFEMAKAKWDSDNGPTKHLSWFKTWDELDKDYQEIWIEDMRVVLRVVLKRIQEGEVVEIDYHYLPNGDSQFTEVVLKPEFQKFMEEK